MIIGGCRICGGTVGDSRQVAHALCVHRTEQGMPTPSLGNACPCCHGTGCHPTGDGPINPTHDMMERWAPACVPCQGSGAVNVADEAIAATHSINATRKRHWCERCTTLSLVEAG